MIAEPITAPATAKNKNRKKPMRANVRRERLSFNLCRGLGVAGMLPGSGLKLEPKRCIGMPGSAGISAYDRASY